MEIHHHGMHVPPQGSNVLRAYHNETGQRPAFSSVLLPPQLDVGCNPTDPRASRTELSQGP